MPRNFPWTCYFVTRNVLSLKHIGYKLFCYSMKSFHPQWNTFSFCTICLLPRSVAAMRLANLMHSGQTPGLNSLVCDGEAVALNILATPVFMWRFYNRPGSDSWVPVSYISTSEDGKFPPLLMKLSARSPFWRSQREWTTLPDFQKGIFMDNISLETWELHSIFTFNCSK